MDTFVIRIDDLPSGGHEYPVALLHWTAAGEQPVADATLPESLQPDGVANPLTLDEILAAYAGAAGAEPLLARAGRQLYACLAQGDIAARLQGLDAAYPAGYRFVLDVRAERLQALPWELARLGDRLLFRRAQAPWCRGRLDQAQEPFTDWPVRVLVVVGSSKADETDVQAEEEVRRISAALEAADADVDLWVAWRPTRERLKRFFAAGGSPGEEGAGFNPHILHFIGHGGTEVLLDGAGGEERQHYLVLHDPTAGPAGQDVHWERSVIFNDFDNPVKPRLVVLNACRSGEFTAAGQGSVAGAFLEAGVPAVLGVRADVSGKHAYLFSERFYEALAGGDSLDVAVARARDRIFNEPGMTPDKREWAAPSLEVRSHPEAVVRIGCVQEARRHAVQGADDFTNRRRMIDRRPDRWQTWRGVKEDGPNVVALVGPKDEKIGIGKSWLANIVMERCALAGLEVRWVNLKDKGQVDPVTVLQRICGGDASGMFLARPLPGGFAAFHQAVAQDATLALDPQAPKEDRLPAYERIFQAFRNDLAAAAAVPMVLVLDYMKIGDWDFQYVLRPMLLKWCIDRKARDIIMVLVLRDEQFDALGLGSQAKLARYDVQGFPPEEWEDLAGEFVRRNLREPDVESKRQAARAALANLVQAQKPFVTERWGPDKLEAVRVNALVFYGYTERKG